MLIISVSCCRFQAKDAENEDINAATSEKTENSSNIKPPYETTWMEITQLENGEYVVYNYPSLWNDGETKSPDKIMIKNNQLIWTTFSDDVITYTFDNVKKCDDSSYFFKIGNRFRFKWIDQEKHIAQWIIYHGNEDPMTRYFYIDSLYNTFPIIDFEWSKDKSIDDF